MNNKSHYDTKGMYNSYDKNHKSRDKWDYYCTPTEEVSNILNVYKPDFNNCTILEPCAGEGHMVKGIVDYIEENHMVTDIVATEFQDRKSKFDDVHLWTGEKFDFLSDDYDKALEKIDHIDWIVMNPPFSTIEPFTIRALEMADKGVIMLGRIQFLEGQNRFENIFVDNPPNYIYTYVDRIQCYKNGDTSISGTSVQAYSWFIWEKGNTNEPVHRWIRRVDKS